MLKFSLLHSHCRPFESDWRRWSLICEICRMVTRSFRLNRFRMNFNRLQKTPPHCRLWADCLENVEASTSHTPMGLHGLLQGSLYFIFNSKPEIMFSVRGIISPNKQTNSCGLPYHKMTSHIILLNGGPTQDGFWYNKRDWIMNETHSLLRKTV
jgi:hypothetical protein